MNWKGIWIFGTSTKKFPVLHDALGTPKAWFCHVAAQTDICRLR